MRFIFRPDDGRPAAPLGGKAAALRALRGSELSIPEWFVVLPIAFDASLTEAQRRCVGLTGRRGAANNSLAMLAPAPSVSRELDAALAELCPAGECVAVRSSAIDEDGNDASFAGQLESFLLVAPQDVGRRIAAVWRSAFSPRVEAYRKQHGLPGVSSPPAVLIQRMIHPEAAGVAFGADPITGSPDLVVVSAVPGLGTALVGGECDADTWHVDASGSIRQIQSARKCAPDDLVNGRVRRTKESDASPSSAALDPAQVGIVARLVRRAGEILGRPQDIEWAIENRRIFLLQARPVTGVGSAARNRGELGIWDNSNIVESYSGVTTPLTFSFARRAYEGVYRQFCHVLAVPRVKIAAHDETFRHMLGLIRGRIYYNLLNWYRVLALLPGFTLNRRFMEQMMGVKEELPGEVLAQLHRVRASDRARDAIDVAFSLAALAANHFLLPAKVRRFYRRLDEALAPSGKPLGAMSQDELRASFCALEAKLLTRWDAPLINDFFAMIFHGVLRRLLTSWIHDGGSGLHNDLLCGEGGMISAEPAHRILELAALAAPHPRFVKLLCAGEPADILDAMEEIPNFKAAYQKYLAAFGERCLEELKLESLTLHDDPLLLLRSVGRLAGPTPAHAAGPGSSSGRGLDARRAAEEIVSRALAGHPVRRLLFRWVLRHARARVRDRENLRFERTRLFGRIRRIFVELGRRLQDQGHLTESRDVFFLELDELLGAGAGTRPREEFKELAARRRVEFAAYRAQPAPPNRVTTRGSPELGLLEPMPLSPVPNPQSSERRGIGCCPGVVRGVVRNVVDPLSSSLHAGEIIVAERTDPGWVMLFPAAAGLLVERGSLLSHSAIVAREMGIPAIVAIDGLTHWLRDGDRVEFDGSTGIVRRFDEMQPNH